MRWVLRTTASVSRLASVKSLPKLLRTESPSTSVPARNATPTSTAVNMPARRRLRLHRSLTITWLMSVSEGLHALEHARGGRGGHQVDDAAVGEEHDLVGVARRVRVVSDHHDGLAQRVDRVAHEAEDV